MTTASDISASILRDIAAGRVPDRPWTPFEAAVAECEGVDVVVESAYYPGEYGDVAAAEWENAVERQAERALR